MENNVIKMKLTGLQMREILEIYTNAKLNKKDEAFARREIRAKLNIIMPGYTENDLQEIYNDCRMYTIVNNIPPYYGSKKMDNDSRTKLLTRDELLQLAKNYIVERYLSTDIEILEEQGTIEEIVNRFINKNLHKNSEIDLLKDITTFMQCEMQEKMDIDEISNIKKEDRYRRIIEMYIKSLIKRRKYEVSREQLISEMIEDGISQDKIEERIKRYDTRNRIRREVLVSDDDAQKFIENDGIKLKIKVAEDYLYDNNGERKIEGSLAEDKLLSTYLNSEHYELFEKRAKEVMEYDDETGKVLPGQARTASKYIKFLIKTQNKKEAIDFIKHNLDIFKNDIVIMNQWYNATRLNGDLGILEIANELTSETVSSDTKIGLYSIRDLNLESINSKSLVFLQNLINDLDRMIIKRENIQYARKIRKTLDKLRALKVSIGKQLNEKKEKKSVELR